MKRHQRETGVAAQRSATRRLISAACHQLEGEKAAAAAQP